MPLIYQSRVDEGVDRQPSDAHTSDEDVIEKFPIHDQFSLWPRKFPTFALIRRYVSRF